MANSLKSKYILSTFILLLVIISDQVTKLQFTSTCNPGIAFSFLESFGRLNILLVFLVLASVVYFLTKQKTRLNVVAVSLVLGGGVSNLVDRIILGCVRDFIDLKFWPSFNLADGMISVGVIIIAFELAFRKRHFNDLNQ